jgi:flagellar hook-associated protein 3 FlgL
VIVAIGSIGSNPNAMVQALIDMRAQFDDLSRQLSTGQKSATYAGLGLGSGLSVSLNAQLSAISGYDNSIDMASTRIDVAQNALGAMAKIGSSIHSMLAVGSISAGNANAAQLTAQSSLQQLLGMLNTQAGNRYLFSGLATDQPSVESYDHILNGDGARAGLTQIIDERSQADLGADGLGRLVISGTPGSVSVAEDAAGSPFGFKLASATSNLSNATLSGPSGSPASLSVNFTGQPSDGDTLTLTFNLPDGTTTDLTLTATTQSPPGDNQFTIGATAAATATNLQNALTTSIGDLASSSLKAASAVAASNEFFSADASNPPQRVDGPPFDTATSLIAGTSANSVIWYTGEAGSGSARSTATARIDPSLVVSYGTRANEDGIRSLVQNVATLAAVTVSSSDPNAAKFGAALNQRLASNLGGSGGTQTVTDIETDLAGAQSSMQTMKSNHQQTSATLNDMLQQITGVSNEEVGSELLALQTRMQASMQTTSILYQTSLVNYLK